MFRLVRGFQCSCRFMLSAALLVAAACASGQPRVVDPNRYHLGVTGKPEWQWFEGRTPFSNRLDIHFAAQANSHEATLFIRQEDVKLERTVQLNGRKLGSLLLMEQPLVHTLGIPPGYLRDGENVLSVLPPNQIDDIMVGEILLDSRPVEEVLQAKLEVQVCEKKTGRGLPCRITLVDERGDLAAIYPSPGQELAA